MSFSPIKTSSPLPQPSYYAFWLMMFVPFSLGIGYPLIKEGLHHLNVTNFIFLRFIIATLFMSVFVFLSFWRGYVLRTWREILGAGFVLGFVNCSASYLQSKGLLTITSGQSAFLTGSSVIFVPFLLHAFRLETLKVLHLFQGALCLSGIFLLSGVADDGALHFSVGVIWTLGSALALAFMVILFEWCARRFGNSLLLVFVQLMTTVALSGLVTGLEGEITFAHSVYVWLIIVACGVFAALALWLQAGYQHQVGALKSSIIISLQGFYAILVAYLFFEEDVSLNELIGAALIFSSIALPRLTPINKHHSLSDKKS